MSTTERMLSDDEKLAELGYKSELKRSFSGFSNFAISFSIIAGGTPSLTINRPSPI